MSKKLILAVAFSLVLLSGSFFTASAACGLCGINLNPCSWHLPSFCGGCGEPVKQDYDRPVTHRHHKRWRMHPTLIGISRIATKLFQAPCLAVDKSTRQGHLGLFQDKRNMPIRHGQSLKTNRKDQAMPFGGIQAHKAFWAAVLARGEYCKRDLPWPDGHRFQPSPSCRCGEHRAIL